MIPYLPFSPFAQYNRSPRVLVVLILWLFTLALPHVQAQSSEEADSSLVEWIEVHFNMPNDPSVANPGNPANSNADLIAPLVQLIDSAKYSVDLCIYDLEHPRVGQALVRAKNRGLRVRVATDNYNRKDSRRLDPAMWAMLAGAGIISIDDDGDVYQPNGSVLDASKPNAGAHMHHKFAVIDVLSPSKQDDYVWTGSTNLTWTGLYNTNNVIVIKDDEMAAAYQQEFEQMWGGQGIEPDQENARFHKDKADVQPHEFYVGATRVELYFAPTDRKGTKKPISERIVELIEAEAQHDVRFCAFSISPDIAISRALWSGSAKGEFELFGVIDPGFYSRYKKSGATWGSVEARIGNRSVLPAKELRKLHHKTLILDAANPDDGDQAVVITGSYNFSKNADNHNDENLLIIYSDTIANQYYQDFQGIYKRATEQFAPPVPDIDPDAWYDVYRVSDAYTIEIELVPGFGYPVRFLGAEAPRIWAGPDSSYYFAGEAALWMQNTLDGAKVQIRGPFTDRIPGNRYGRFHAYVDAKVGNRRFSVNAALLQAGMARYSSRDRQNEDSVAAYQALETEAKQKKSGMWLRPKRVGTKIPKTKALKDEIIAESVFPINLNTADMGTLTLLPGIGPSRARQIIEYREKNGGFKSVDQITRIKGIGPKTLAKLRPKITI